MSDMTTKTYTIQGMHCSSCAMSIDWALEDLDGVKEATTSYAKGFTKVSFDPARVTDATIAEVIQEAGFTVAAG